MGGRTVRRATVAALGLGLLLGACTAPAPPPDSAQVEEWVGILYPLPKVERFSPPVSARLYAYAGLALYEGLRRADPDAGSLGGRVGGLDPIPEPPEGRHDWSVVAAEAERQVLSGMIEAYALPSTMVQVDTIAEGQIERRRRAGVDEKTVERSIAYAGRIAEVVLARATSDGFSETRRRPYDLPAGRGIWTNTTTLEEYAPISASEASQFVRRDNPSAALVPGVANARQMVLDRPSASSEPVGNINPLQPLEPHWGEITPFGFTDFGSCAPPEPHPWSLDRDSPFWAEVMAVYETSVGLTEEEREIAYFWADNPGSTGTPPGHWVAIMRQMIPQLGLPPVEAARMFAVTSLAMHDAFVSTWEVKYRTMVERPITFIRDHIDPEWDAAVVTPPFPEYTSGHSVVSGAAAEALTALLGEVAFADSTHVASGLSPRPFSSFLEAAEEAAISRLYGGIHYPMAIDDGVRQGRCLTRVLLDRLGSAVPVGPTPELPPRTERSAAGGSDSGRAPADR